MKIVKKTDTTNWSHKHICSQCDTELLIEKGDIKYKYEPGDFRDPSYESWFCNCPVCSAGIHVPADRIPKAVQVEIKQGRLASPGLSYVK